MIEHTCDFPIRPCNICIYNRSKQKCVYLSEPTGERVPCKTCSGKVELKVYECKIYGNLTLDRCKNCGSYSTSTD